jgi:cell division inhibitor SepF
MAGRDIWHRTLVYFGLAEDETLYDDLSTVHEEPARPSRSAGVRRLDRFRGGGDEGVDEADDLFAEEETAPGRRRRRPSSDTGATSVLRAPAAPSRPAASAVKVHVIAPRAFNDAQQIADRFKNGVPVIVNLQTAEPELSKRLIDFGSGLTYALDGAMQRIAEKVFLLTPRDVEVSAEDRQRLVEQGFFNPT